MFKSFGGERASPGARYPNREGRSFAPFLLVLYAHRAGQHDASNGPLFREWVSPPFLRRHFQSIWTNRFFSPTENNNSPCPRVIRRMAIRSLVCHQSLDDFSAGKKEP